MTQPTNDLFGFPREAWESTTKLDRYQRGPCLTLMIHLYDKAQAEGRHYDHTDRQLHTEVMKGKIPCPLQSKCTKYQTAIQRKGTPIPPYQFSFADLQGA